MAELVALPPQIAKLEAGGYIAQPEGTVEITENGIHNVKPYAKADVNVQPDLGTLDITENGTYSASTYDKDGFEEVTVDVQPDLIEKTITSNGTYTASDDGVDGYSKAIVNVPVQEQKTVVITKGDEPTTIVPDSGYTSMKEVNASVSLTSTTFTPSKSRQTRTPAQGVAGFSKAICLPAPLENKTVTPTTQRQQFHATDPYIGFNEITIEATPLESKTITPTTQQQTVYPQSPNIGFSSVKVGATAPPPVLITKQITANGTYAAEDDNADGYDKVEVAVPRTVPIAESSLTPAAVGMDGNGVYISDDTSDETLISMGRDLTGIFAEDVA